MHPCPYCTRRDSHRHTVTLTPGKPRAVDKKQRCLDDSVTGGCQRGHGHDGGHCSYDIDDKPGMRDAT